MAKLLEEWKEDLVEALTEHDLLLGSKHQKIEHAVLLVRNIAVGAALVLFIASLAVGGLIGTVLDLDGRFKKATSKIGGSNLAEGLTTGCLLYCIGTLSMVGPVMSALFDDNTFLFTNAMLDLVTSTVLASTYGIGMLLAAPVLFCWQGTFYLIAKMSSSAISDALIAEVSIVGGVLIVCSGLSLLNIKDCHTLNLIPSLLVPVLFFAAKFLLF